MAVSENLIQLQDGAKSFGTRELFKEATFSINTGEHVGVMGPNGAGKTTLFKILLGEEGMDSGAVIRSRQLRIGYLSQHDLWGAGETGMSYLEANCQMPLWELISIGKSLGLTEALLDCPVHSLSGGYRMRIKLLGLVGQMPNLMLLDEPTNYLDLETTLVLERFLQGFEGSFLLISHDREFLRRTTDTILEVEGGEITKFSGNIDDYFEQKELIRNQLESRAQGLADKRKAVLDFVARFGAKATKAKQAQSRLKSLNKMETIELKPIPISAQIRIPAPTHTGKVVLRMDGCSFGYGDRVVLKGVDLAIVRGERIAVVGLNGAGKSTLLKGISEVHAPIVGKIDWGMDVRVSYFAQHVVEDLKADDTVFQSLEKSAHASVLPQEILDLAGSLLFSGEAVKKKIGPLSGGEKTRVALGRVLLKKAPFLILDEPTNHLDFQTVEALTEALRTYAGTVLFVSHDRGFVRRAANRILEVAAGKVNLYPGTYDEYVWSVQQGVFAETQSGGGSGKGSAAKAIQKNEVNAEPVPERANWKEAKKNLERRSRQIERRIPEIEAKLEKIQVEMSQVNQQLIEDSSASKDLIRKFGDLQEDQSQLEKEWMELLSEKEGLDSELAKLHPSSN